MFTSTFKLSYQLAGQYIVRLWQASRLILAVSQVQLFLCNSHAGSLHLAYVEQLNEHAKRL